MTRIVIDAFIVDASDTDVGKITKLTINMFCVCVWVCVCVCVCVLCVYLCVYSMLTSVC